MARKPVATVVPNAQALLALAKQALDHARHNQADPLAVLSCFLFTFHLKDWWRPGGDAQFWAGCPFAQVIAEVANGTKHLEIGDPRLTSNPAAKEVVARPAMGGAINTHPLNTAPLNFWRPAQIVVLTRRATGDPDMLIPAVDILAEALAWWERTLPAGV